MQGKHVVSLLVGMQGSSATQCRETRQSLNQQSDDQRQQYLCLKCLAIPASNVS